MRKVLTVLIAVLFYFFFYAQEKTYLELDFSLSNTTKVDSVLLEKKHSVFIGFELEDLYQQYQERPNKQQLLEEIIRLQAQILSNLYIHNVDTVWLFDIEGKINLANFIINFDNVGVLIVELNNYGSVDITKKGMKATILKKKYVNEILIDAITPKNKLDLSLLDKLGVKTLGIQHYSSFCLQNRSSNIQNLSIDLFDGYGLFKYIMQFKKINYIFKFKRLIHYNFAGSIPPLPKYSKYYHPEPSDTWR